MIRKLFGLLLIVGALLGLKELHRYWEQVKSQQAAKDRQSIGAPALSTPPPAAADGIPALAPGLEASLREAKGQSPAALRLTV